jgi:hypothetical protein
MTGLASADEANRVFWRMKNLIVNHNYIDESHPLRREQRHDARFIKMLLMWGVPLKKPDPEKAKQKKKTKTEEPQEEEEEEDEDDDVIFDAVLDLLQDENAPAHTAQLTTQLSPFMRFCDSGQIKNVQMCIDMGDANLTTDRDEEGRNALERLQANPGLLASSPAHQRILRMLLELKGHK